MRRGLLAIYSSSMLFPSLPLSRLLSLSLSIPLFIFLSLKTAAQDLPLTTLVTLSPDEYTAWLIGELELPNDVIVRLDDGKEVSNVYSSADQPASQSAPQPALQVESASNTIQGEVLEGKEAEAAATVFYIKDVLANLQRVGLENTVKIYQSVYDMPRDEITGFLRFLETADSEHQSAVNDARRNNCVSFNQDIEESSQQTAIENMAAADLGLISVSVGYFSEMMVSLEKIVPDVVMQDIQVYLKSMQSNMSPYGAKSLQRLEESGQDLGQHFSVICEQMLDQSL